MKCARCGKEISPDDSYNHFGQDLCEDCYMIVLSPVKTCDPWAVHSAKSFEKQSGGIKALTPLQQQILDVLTKEGPLPPEQLLKRCDAAGIEDLKRAFASLP